MSLTISANSKQKDKTSCVKSMDQISHLTPKQWLTKIQTLHKKKVTPELKKRMLLRQMRCSAQRKSKKKAKSAWIASTKSQRNYTKSMSTVSRLASARKRGGGSSGANTKGLLPFTNTISSLMGFGSGSITQQHSAGAPSSSLQFAAAMNKCIAEDEKEALSIQADLHNYEKQQAQMENVALNLNGALVDITEQMQEKIENVEDLNQEELDELQTLLKQLKVEPEEDEEREAKFKLYEAFLSTVEVIRKQMEKIVKESEIVLPANTRAKFVSRLKNLNSAQFSGIYDDDFDGATTWFVYHMAVQASKNREHISKMMKDLEIYLSLLEQECECPMCLEPLKDLEEKEVTVLACCHKVCTSCWQKWKEIRGQKGVFCPLCRNEEFTIDIMSN